MVNQEVSTLFISTRDRHFYPNLFNKVREALHTLCNDDSIVINPPDKGGAVVIQVIQSQVMWFYWHFKHTQVTQEEDNGSPGPWCFIQDNIELQKCAQHRTSYGARGLTCANIAKQYKTFHPHTDTHTHTYTY